MTLQDLLDHALASPAAAPLRLETPRGPIGPGYHLTEFKLARIAAIDCVGRRSDSEEARMQVLPAGRHATMELGKLARILARSLSDIPGLGAAPLRVEHTPRGEGMQIFEVAEMRRSADGLVLSLLPAVSVCKPAEEAARHGAACCGPMTV